LVVEDEAHIAALLETGLAAHGYSVEWAKPRRRLRGLPAPQARQDGDRNGPRCRVPAADQRLASGPRNPLVRGYALVSGRLTFVPEAAHPPTDPRDPLGLRADAPLLDGWLASTDAADRGALTLMCTPGHKQRHDLTGAVVAGDTPLYGGVDTIKHAATLPAQAESPAARPRGATAGRLSVAGSADGS